jgi:hypothetical protein
MFLQAVVVLIGLAALAFLLGMPQLEGRNKNATQFEVYFKDPFLVYAYVASIPFFMALYQAFKALGYAGQNEVFSPAAVKAFRTIRYCAMVLIGFIIVGVLILLSSESDDHHHDGSDRHVRFSRDRHRGVDVRTGPAMCRRYQVRERPHRLTRPSWQLSSTSTSCWQNER